MMKIRNAEDLERWLKTQPREVAIAIATRAALRVLPALGGWLRWDEKKAIVIVLPVFRANAVSRFSVISRDAEVQKIAAHASQAAAHAATIADAAAAAAYAAAAAAAYAASNSFTTIAAKYTRDAARVVGVHAGFATDYSVIIWNSTEHDAKIIEDGTTALKLIRYPLWPNGTPFWALNLWQTMKKRLMAREDEHWEVWTEWYDAILDPDTPRPCYSPPNWELERARVLIDEDLWEQGPAAVNARIKELIEKYRAEGKCPKDDELDLPPPRPSKEKEKEKEKPPSALKTTFVSDLPNGEVDYLNRAELARVLAAQLNEMWDEQTACRWDNWHEGRPAPGFVVHIDSPWGGGKTSFAALVAKILNPWADGDKQPDWLNNLALDNDKLWPEEYRRPWRIVWFNAWQHEHLNPPWWSFYETIRNQLFSALLVEKRLGECHPPPDVKQVGCPYERICSWLKWARLRIAEFFWNLFTKDRTFTIIGSLVFAIILFSLWIAGIIQFFDGPQGKMSLGVKGTWGTILAIMLVGIPAISKTLANLRRIFMPGLPEEADSRILGTTDPLNRMRRHFRNLLESVGDPVLVIVDDLDRCHPRYVVELIRGMQTVLNSPRVIFMMLGDRDWIEQAFDTVHKEMRGLDVGPEHNFGGRFVEKAIQFSLILPEIGEGQRQQFMRHVLGVETDQTEEAAPEHALEPLPEEARKELEHILQTPSFAEREKRATELLKDIKPDETALRQVQLQLSRRASVDEGAKIFIRHELEALAPVLPANPRQMKRIINAISILQEVVRLNDPSRHPGSADWYKLVRWVVLMIEWPRTWVTLTKKTELLTEATKDWPDWLQNDEKARRLISGEGLPTPWNRPITQSDIKDWLAPNIPAASGKPWPNNDKEETSATE